MYVFSLMKLVTNITKYPTNKKFIRTRTFHLQKNVSSSSLFNPFTGVFHFINIINNVSISTYTYFNSHIIYTIFFFLLKTQNLGLLLIHTTLQIKRYCTNIKGQLYGSTKYHKSSKTNIFKEN